MEVSGKFLITENLSPHKVALLFIVTLYISNELPCRQNILALLVNQLEGQPIQKDSKLLIAPTLRDLCEAIYHSTASKITRKGEQTEFQIEVEEALTGSDNPKNNIKAAIFKLLDLFWNISSPNDLHRTIVDTFAILLDAHQITTLENRRIVSPRSFIGRFIQKVVISQKLLHFDESSQLFTSICEYRVSSSSLYESLKTMNLPPANISFQNPIVKQTPLFPTWTTIVRDQFSRSSSAPETDDTSFFEILNNQLNDCLEMGTAHLGDQKGNSTIVSIPKLDLEALVNKQVQLLEKFGTPTPAELKAVMKWMASPNSDTCAVQSTYCSQLPSYYYLQYLENLKSGDYHGAFDSLHQYFDYMVSKGSKSFYHFALISRASLHQYFGEDKKALDSIEEAISVARENKDNATLTYILSWLFNFIKHKPKLWSNQNLYQNNNELRLLDFLIKKSQTVSLLLSAMSYRFETDYLMSSGGSMSKYVESLFKAIFISINDLLPSFVKSCELASIVWTRVGIPYLGELYAEIGHQYAKINGTSNDILGLQIRRNYLKYWRGHTEDALSNLEMLFPEVSRNISHHRTLQTRKMLMQIEIDLKKGRKKFAEDLMQSLWNSEDDDYETESEKTRLLSMIHTSNGNNSQSLVIISQHFSILSSQFLAVQLNLLIVIRLNLLKASIFNRSGAHARAFSLVVQQIQQSKKIGFQSLIVEAIALLVSVLNNLGNNQDAYQIAEDILPTCIQVGNQQLISTVYFELAKSCCILLESSEEEEKFISRKELFTRFLNFLSISITGFKKSLDLVLLTECFELEQRMAQASNRLKDELRNSKPFEDFRNHSQVGLKILYRRATEESDYGYLTPTR